MKQTARVAMASASVKMPRSLLDKKYKKADYS